MHETLITAYARPAYFQDTMGRGYFQHFQHDHHFTVEHGRTVMHDQVRFTLPFGVAGRLVGQLIVVPHVVGLVKRRFALLKSLAEATDGRRSSPARRSSSSPLRGSSSTHHNCSEVL